VGRKFISNITVKNAEKTTNIPTGGSTGGAGERIHTDATSSELLYRDPIRQRYSPKSLSDTKCTVSRNLTVERFSISKTYVTKL